MQDFIAQGVERGSFEDNRLPVLIYICPLELDTAGQEMHSHPGYAELMLVRSGKGVVNVDGRQEHLSAGDFVLCGAGEPHSYQSDREEPLKGVSCGFARLMCRGMEENCFIAHPDQPWCMPARAVRGWIHCFPYWKRRRSIRVRRVRRYAAICPPRS